MSLNGYSHASILRWAKQNFPTDFQQLPGAKDVAVQLHKVPGRSNTGYLKGLVIGTAMNEKDTTVDVLAWLEGKQMLVGYVSKVGARLQDVRYDSYESVMQSVEVFKEPFCWIVESEDEEAFAQIEALVRYFFLLKGSMQAVKDNLEDFAAYFSGACRHIAAAKGVDWEEPSSREGSGSLGCTRKL